MKTKITYGRKRVGDKLVGYASWEEGGHKIELFSEPYKPLIKLVDGKPAKVTEKDVFIWTKVSGWIGTEELLQELRPKKSRKIRKSTTLEEWFGIGIALVGVASLMKGIIRKEIFLMILILVVFCLYIKRHLKR